MEDYSDMGEATPEKVSVEGKVSVEQTASVEEKRPKKYLVSQKLKTLKWPEFVALNDRTRFSSEVERQQSLRKLEMALSQLMPWNDAHFSRINVRTPYPSEFRSDADFRILEGNLCATVRVCIGSATFWCIPALQQLHSGYFSRHLPPVSRFREGTDLCAVGFRAAYDWMRLKKLLDANSQPGKLVELQHTAIQLDIGSLEVMCNRYLCSSQCREQAAFDIYMQAGKFAEVLHPQHQLMLQRIGFDFLAMVGDSSYLDLPVEDLLIILKQDTLGVNTELEVFYSVIRWMAVRPKERSRMIHRLFDCVRFTRMPLKMLRHMWRCTTSPDFEGDLSFRAVWRHDPDILQRISEAITVVGYRGVYTENEFKNACRSSCLAVEAPREWLYDEDCPYHQPRPRKVYPRMISYDEFLNYVTLRAQKARETPRELINLRAVLPLPEIEEEDDDDDLEQVNREDLDYISADMLRHPRKTNNSILPPIMESASEREEDPDDECLSPEEWNEMFEFITAQSEIGAPAPATAPTQLPASTSTDVLFDDPIFDPSDLPAPTPASFWLRDRHDSEALDERMLLGEGLSPRVVIPTNMRYSEALSHLLMPICGYNNGVEEEANHGDEDILCRRRYAADLENMCNGQPLAPEVDVGCPEDQQPEVVPFESYLLDTSVIMADILARIGEKEDAEVKEVPELAPEEKNSQS
ncbi:hypothetical protein KR074_001164 [Drosophila pseudoananassae]|nr:hypothetical protein KR074_001164 [Drosophila pseudoananassae]